LQSTPRIAMFRGDRRFSFDVEKKGNEENPNEFASNMGGM
jgi:hypothetical protein